MNIPEAGGRFQGQWEFNQWEEAFKFYHERLEFKPKQVMIISTHWASEGYWIEDLPDDYTPSEDLPETDHLYRSIEEVKALEGRVREAVEGVENYSGGLIL